jgi:hypothetical protein
MLNATFFGTAKGILFDLSQSIREAPVSPDPKSSRCGGFMSISVRAEADLVSK